MKKTLLFSGIILMMLVVVACGEEEVDVDGKMVTYEELQAKIVVAESDLEEIQGEVSEAQDELSEVKDAISDNSDKYEGLEELADSRDELTEEVSDAEKELETLKTEINKLEDEIVEVTDEPIQVNPGFYYFGEDLEPGRYKMTAQEGQRGNVFVREEGKRGSFVGETFGDGTNRSVKEFTFQASPGDEIEASIPVLLYPVE